MSRLLKPTLMLLLLISTGGCAQLLALKGPWQPSEAERLKLETAALAETVRTLRDSEEAAQRRFTARLRDAFVESPTVENRLRLALALSSPGASASELREAAALLDAVRNDQIRPDYQAALVLMREQEIAQRLELAQEITRLRSQLARTRRDVKDANRALVSQQAEILHIRDQLNSANEKLRAVTSIEAAIEPLSARGSKQ